jgi:tetratricopeptide (TPR) repeat protein
MVGGPLQGRSRELALLDEDLRVAITGRRTIALITGEAGIGKTRLLDALAARAAASGARTAWGRTWEVGLTPAFWPWRQVLSALEDPDARAPALDGLDERADAASRLARFEQVAAFVARRATVAPVAILLEDLHAADPSSLLLFEFVARHLHDARVLIAATVRDGETTPEVASALGRVRREARTLPLARLGADEVAALCEGRVAPSAIARIHELSEGNPLFVEELVASAGPGGAHLERLSRVSSVRALIRERIARLPPATAAALEAAALVGREVRGLVVADVLGVAHDDLVARLDAAAAAGVVAPVSADRWRFSHALVAEALADEMSPSEQARLHLRAAQAIERHEGSDDGAVAIAHHLLAAGHLAAGAAVDAAEKAAAAAATRLAFEDAAELLERALAALTLAAPDDRARRAELLCAQAEVLQHAGQHERAGSLCTRAAELARVLGDGALMARIALARGIELRFGQTDHVLVQDLEDALRLLPDGDSPERARVLARLAAALQPAADPRGPVARGFEAIAMARRIGDARTLLDVIHVAFAALIDYVEPERLTPLLDELLALATSPRDRLVALRARLRQCFVTIDALDRPAFELAIASYTAAAKATGLARPMWPAHLLRAMVAVLDGRFADASRAADEAELAAESAGDPQGATMAQMHRVMADRVRTAPIDERLREWAEAYGPGRVYLLIMVEASLGNQAATRALLAQTHIEAHDNLMLTMLADGVVAVGDKERAVQLLDVLAERSGRAVIASMIGTNVCDIIDRVRLALSVVAERLDSIDQIATAAIALCDRLGAVPLAARTRADWAAALDARGRGDDRERADALWAAAAAEAKRLGMPGLEARCAARSGAPATATATARTTAAAATASSNDGVTLVRAGDLWTVSGFGSVVHVRDSRGIQMLARLVAEPGRDLHALDLAGSGEAVDGGDAGPMLDETARRAYRARAIELREELEEAEQWNDPARAQRARTELDALTAEVERAVGLGGRDRKVGAASERARSNVQRRISHALQQIRAAAPRLGEHLVAAVHTGMYCVYKP